MFQDGSVLCQKHHIGTIGIEYHKYYVSYQYNYYLCNDVISAIVVSLTATH